MMYCDYKGQRLPISEIAEREGVSDDTIRRRIKAHGNPLKKPEKTYRYGNEMLTIGEIAKRENITRKAVFSRLGRGSETKQGQKERVRVCIDGHTFTLTELAKKYNTSYELLYARKKKGLKGRDIIAGLSQTQASADLIAMGYRDLPSISPKPKAGRYVANWGISIAMLAILERTKFYNLRAS